MHQCYSLPAAAAQGGFHRTGTKLHRRAEGNGRPIAAVPTGGERQEQIALERRLDQGAIRPGARSAAAAPAQGCRRQSLFQSDRAPPPATLRITPAIPTKSNERRNPRFDRAACRRRNRIERLSSRLTQPRRIAIRYDKSAVDCHAMVAIGMIKLWL